MKTTSNGRWPQNIKRSISQQPLIGSYSNKEECVFLHKISKECKFGFKCEREMCMFRHGVVEEVTEKNIETADQSEILDVDEEEETNV